MAGRRSSVLGHGDVVGGGSTGGGGGRHIKAHPSVRAHEAVQAAKRLASRLTQQRSQSRVKEGKAVITKLSGKLNKTSKSIDRIIGKYRPGYDSATASKGTPNYRLDTKAQKAAGMTKSDVAELNRLTKLENNLTAKRSTADAKYGLRTGADASPWRPASSQSAPKAPRTTPRRMMKMEDAAREDRMRRRFDRTGKSHR